MKRQEPPPPESDHASTLQTPAPILATPRQYVVTDKDTDYHARVWRTKVLREQANLEVLKMLLAFVPSGFAVTVSEGEFPVPGYPHVAPYNVRAILHDPKPNGSDAHFFADAHIREGALAKLLALILDGRSFFPLT